MAADQDPGDAPVDTLASRLADSLKTCRTMLDDYRSKIGDKGRPEVADGESARSRGD